MCPARELRDVHVNHILRTEATMKQVVNDILSAPSASEAERISKEYSLHPVNVCFFFKPEYFFQQK